MSCLTNKLKFHMIFTCKNFMLSNLTRKNFFCFRKWYGGWGKACQWNLINFSQFANALIKKEKKHLRSSQWETKKRGKLDFAFVLYFLNMIINLFFVSQAHSQPNFCFLIPPEMMMPEISKGEVGTANSYKWRIATFISKVILID